MTVVPKSSWPAVKAMLHSVYDQPDAAAVEAQFDRLLDYTRDLLPEAADHLEAARADLLAYRRLPRRGMETDLVQQAPKNASTDRSVAGPTFTSQAVVLRMRRCSTSERSRRTSGTTSAPRSGSQLASFACARATV